MMKKLLAMICAILMLTTAMLPAFAEGMVGMANPWTETTMEGLQEDPGFPFALPEGATDVTYQRLEGEELAQISLRLEETALTFRMQEVNEWTDISGLYFNWENQEEETIGWCSARFMQAKNGDQTVELLLWYDAVPGIMYSLSAEAADLDGFDLKAVALQMYVPAQDEADGFAFSELADVTFEFSSGVGGWGTEMSIDENGAFTGNYHDSEMGEIGEAYPNGTVYGCDFHGTFAEEVTQLASHTWQLTVQTLELDEGQLAESIEDGIRYVTAGPYGIIAGHTYILYTPGIELTEILEDCQSWLHLNESGTEYTNLPCYALYDATEGTAFVGWEND